MAATSTLILADRDIRGLLTMSVAIDLMREAFSDLSSGDAVVPVRQVVEVAPAGATMLSMPAYRASDATFGIKLISIHDGNPNSGRPRSIATVVVIDAATGDRLGVLDGGYLTAVRTGAGAGLATDLLARRDSKTVAIFGAGQQAETQLEAVCAVRPIRTAYVFARSARSAADMTLRMAGRLPSVNVVPQPSRALIAEADIICTATNSPTPVVFDAELGSGVHINGVGSHTATMAELPARTVNRSLVFVDERGAALVEAGDLIQAAAVGLHDPSDVAELGDVVRGTRTGRVTDSDVTFFKSVGNGVQDLAVAKWLVERARILGIGTSVDLR